MINNEHEGTRNLLRKSLPVTGAPAGLEVRVMESVLAIEEKKAKKRAALSGLLRFTSIGLVLIAIGQCFFPKNSTRTFVAAAGQATQNPAGKMSWLIHNVYFLIPLLVLFLVSKIVRLKAE